MKHLALSIMLALAPLCWAESEIEWPLELTCITPGEIFQLHLTGEPKTSWVMPLMVTDGPLQPFREKQVFQKIFRINLIEEFPHNLRVSVEAKGLLKGNGSWWVISPYTLLLNNAASPGLSLRAPHGSCELGLLGLDAFERKF